MTLCKKKKKDTLLKGHKKKYKEVDRKGKMKGEEREEEERGG